MATESDIAQVIHAALTEIGVSGRLEVRGEGELSDWIGSPTGDDLLVVVTVTPLNLD